MSDLDLTPRYSMKRMRDEIAKAREYERQQAATEISTLRRRVEELEGALRPFAEVGERVLSEAPANATMFTVMTDCEGDMVQVSLEYFRAAILALSSGRDEE